MMKGKIHRATVTDSNLDYEGSITIDANLMDNANIIPYEAVDIYNVTSGERFSTYAIKGEKGSGIICINGAAAHLVREGDLVIIVAYQQLTDEDVRTFKPRKVFVDSRNRIVRTELGDGIAAYPRELATV